MIRRPFFYAILTLAFSVVLPGCLTIQRHTHSEPYSIQHHTWWNYYRRGRHYLRDGKYNQARADFETALGLRPGARYPYKNERWRARTYGMHIQESYFPHRELGICLFKLNRSNEALQQLETSMEMEPSARARFYLNRIREQQAVAAAPPPALSITDAPDWTNRTSLSLKGLASGSNPVSKITINGEPDFVELANTQLSFSREVPLTEGLNRIHIAAEDISGKQTETNLTVMADWSPPQLHLLRKAGQFVVSCSDNLALQKLEANGRTIESRRNEESIILPARGPFRLTVCDRAGNHIEWTLSSKEIAHLSESRTPEAPHLKIAGAGQTLTQFSPEYGLDIRAEDDTALRTVKLNGRDLLTRPTPLFRSLQRVPLTLGTNHLSVVTEDYDGNRTAAQLNVVYRQPEYIDKIYRLSTLLPAPGGEIPSAAFARRTARLIGDEITRDPARFFLLADPNETTILQQEQSLSESELADPCVLLKKGSKLDADLIFVTRILRDAPGETIYTQVLDTNSGKELFIEDVYLEDPQQLPQQLNGLVMKLEQRLPLLRGRISESGGRLTINAGENSGALENMRLLVIRSDGPVEQGHIVRHDGHPAELVISKVESASATVIIPRGQPENSAQPGDYVFSR